MEAEAIYNPEIRTVEFRVDGKKVDAVEYLMAMDAIDHILTVPKGTLYGFELGSDPLRPPIGTYLRHVRLMHELDLDEAAQRIGWTERELKQIEDLDNTKDPKVVSPHRYWKVAKLYGLDYVDLMCRAGHMIPRG